MLGIAWRPPQPRTRSSRSSSGPSRAHSDRQLEDVAGILRVRGPELDRGVHRTLGSRARPRRSVATRARRGLTVRPSGQAPPMDAARAVLRDVFGHAAFRAGQREAVEAVLAGRDAVVLLPTGAGKSLCYQVPAVVAVARAAAARRSWSRR